VRIVYLLLVCNQPTNQPIMRLIRFLITHLLARTLQVFQRVLHEHDGNVLLETIIHSITNGRHLLENALPTKDIDKIWIRINGVCYVLLQISQQ